MFRTLPESLVLSTSKKQGCDVFQLSDFLDKKYQVSPAIIASIITNTPKIFLSTIEELSSRLSFL